MSRLVINERGITRLFSNPQGPVARIVKQKADSIEAHAKDIISEKFDSRTGDLEASLHQVPIQGSPFHIAVGADAQHRGFPYARALELGENPLTGGPLLGGNTRGEGGPQVPIEDKSFMRPAVVRAGFRLRA